MAKDTVKLTQSIINNLQPGTSKYRVWDTGTGAVAGLYYIVRPTNKRSWHLKMNIMGRRLEPKIGDGIMSLKQARDIAALWQAEAVKGNDPRKVYRTQAVQPNHNCTFREAINLYAENATAHGKSIHRHTIHHLMAFADWLDKPVSAITQALVCKQRQIWLTKPSARTGRPLTAATVNRRTAALWPVLDWAASQGYCPKLDCRIERLKYNSSKERRHLNNDNERLALHIALAAVKDTYLPTAVKFMLNTGVRPGTLCSLEWSDFNLPKHKLHLRAEIMKGGSDWTIPLNGTAYRTITQWQKSTGSYTGKVFPCSVEALSAQFNIIAGTAGLKGFTLYCLRHSFAMDLLSRNVNILLVQKLMCHSNISQTLVYTHVNESQLAEAAASLESILCRQ